MPDLTKLPTTLLELVNELDADELTALSAAIEERRDTRYDELVTDCRAQCCQIIHDMQVDLGDVFPITSCGGGAAWHTMAIDSTGKPYVDES